MDWITGLCLAIMSLIGVQASRLQTVPMSKHRRLASGMRQRHKRYWAIRIPLLGWTIVSVDSLRETLAGSLSLPALWLARCRVRYRDRRNVLERESARSSSKTRRRNESDC